MNEVEIFMKKMIKRIKNSAGETIAETLVALLISSLALVILAGAITTSSGIILSSSEKIKDYFSESNRNLVEMNKTDDGEVRRDDSKNNLISFDVDVKYAKSDKLKYNGKSVVSFVSR